jgi:hypothetical protein
MGREEEGEKRMYRSRKKEMGEQKREKMRRSSSGKEGRVGCLCLCMGVCINGSNKEYCIMYIFRK